jgi:hypothetical protein
MTPGDAIDYVRAIAPRVTIAMHDAILTEPCKSCMPAARRAGRVSLWGIVGSIAPSQS